MHRFSLDPGTAALVVIDMQEFSCALKQERLKRSLDRVIACINRLAAVCRESRVPVIWVRHNIRSQGADTDGGLFGLFHDAERTQAVMDFGPGTALYHGMAVDAGDHIVFKNRYSAFLSRPPELQHKLRELGRKQLLITGIAANVCVESTLRDAMQLDYQVILVADATMGTDEQALQATLSNTRRFFGDVRTADGIIRELSENKCASER